MQGQGWRRPGYTMQSQDTLKVVNLHLTAGPGGGAGPPGHFSLDLHSYCKLLDEGVTYIIHNIKNQLERLAEGCESIGYLSLSCLYAQLVLVA